MAEVSSTANVLHSKSQFASNLMLVICITVPAILDKLWAAIVKSGSKIHAPPEGSTSHDTIAAGIWQVQSQFKLHLQLSHCEDLKWDYTKTG